MRVEKLKNSGAIAGSEHHSQRSRDTPNADVNKVGDNLRFIGLPSAKLEEVILERIGDNGGKKIRKSADPKQQAVLALEMILTASPEYFRPNSPEIAGLYEPDLLDDWLETNKRWLNETFGDKIVRAELHLDEATPHIHAYLVPINPKGSLSAYHFVGDKKKLSELQTNYAEAMQPLGITRGIKGSRAKHENIKDYYKRVEKEASSELSVEDLARHSIDRQRQIVKKQEAEQTAEKLAGQVAMLEKTIGWQNARLSSFQKTQTQTHSLRDIPLDEVAEALHLKQNEVSPNRWQNERHNVKISGSKFYDFKTGKGGGGAIDLVMAIRDANFQEAIQWLDEELGAGAGRIIANAEIDRVGDVPRRYIGIPKPSLAKWEVVRAALIRTTELPSKLIDKLHEDGIVYASADDRAVFIERDGRGRRTGAIILAADGNYTRCTGDERGAFYVGPLNAREVIFVDTPIDAMAQNVLDGPKSKQRKYVARGGATAHIQHSKNADSVSVLVSRGENLDGAYKQITEDIPMARRYVQEKSPQQLLRAKMKKLKREIGSMVDAMEQYEPDGL